MSTARKGSKKSPETRAPEQTQGELGSSTQGELGSSTQGELGSSTSEGSGVETERRKAEDRRSTDLDRRAFWRPTPDRRREERELGRRSGDRPAS